MEAKHRVLFLGQKPFGERAWIRLLKINDANFITVAACTNFKADTVWWGSNKIFQTHGHVPLIDNSTRNTQSLLQAIKRYRVNLILCVQHPWVLPPEILSLVDYNAINFHNAKLPKYRGYNAVNHALLNGDRKFTCTAHWIADEVDAGDIAFECSFEIEADETAISLYAKCHHAGLALFDEVVTRLLRGEAIPRKPIEDDGQFYPRYSIDSLREIKKPFSSEAEIKARTFFFPPFEPAYMIRNGQKFYILPPKSFENHDLRVLETHAILMKTARGIADRFTYQIS